DSANRVSKRSMPMISKSCWMSWVSKVSPRKTFSNT
ncbi:pseudouridine synthase domain protein, partial [Vibrio parahaemolyticus V-223/04]